MTSTADTRPAIAYEPVYAWIISTVPMPTMDIGRRARPPAAENAAAPGARSTSR
ncbi:hypothetical protein [Xylanimonas allomyrinae]|uniref:hypothetical protein n=1 Tax=Xylanimonas allomyrinae TaxID=2509459 RepID=UPI00268233F6